MSSAKLDIKHVDEEESEILSIISVETRLMHKLCISAKSAIVQIYLFVYLFEEERVLMRFLQFTGVSVLLS